MLAPPPQVARAVEAIESAASLDEPAARIGRAADVVGRGRRGQVLRGEWMGHALHPMLTDMALGCWVSATVLDLAAWRRGDVAARRLVGVGLVAAVPTVASGLAEFGTIKDAPTRRVAAVHGIGNVAATAMYLSSWRARRRGQHARGALLALVAGMVGMVTGHLGGHLSFVLDAGSGRRGGVDGAASAGATDEATPPQQEPVTIGEHVAAVAQDTAP